jgi:hypothetical protein
VWRAGQEERARDAQEDSNEKAKSFDKVKGKANLLFSSRNTSVVVETRHLLGPPTEGQRSQM